MFESLMFSYNIINHLTLIPGMGGEITPSVVFAENRLVSNGMRQLLL